MFQSWLTSTYGPQARPYGDYNYDYAYDEDDVDDVVVNSFVSAGPLSDSATPTPTSGTLTSGIPISGTRHPVTLRHINYNYLYDEENDDVDDVMVNSFVSAGPVSDGATPTPTSGTLTSGTTPSQQVRLSMRPTLTT